MARYWTEMSHDLAFLACSKAFEGKWDRNDVLSYVEEWTGHDRKEIMIDEAKRGGPGYGIKHEILKECALALENEIEAILHGVDPDFDPVQVRDRIDGASGKQRKIAYLCVRHQLLGHAIKLGMEKLLNARILQTQHASLPGRGQHGLKRQVQRWMRRKLGIRAAQKTDCTGAYASVMYEMIIRIVRDEIPRGRWIHAGLGVYGKYAPGGHLIIGGYLDAWLFNFVMSYGLRHVLGLKRSRRGNRYPLIIRAAAFMDDTMLAGRSITAMRQALREMKLFFWERFRMSVRATTGIIRIGPEDTYIDMAGYRIYRDRTTIRRRNWRRTRRGLIRAREEIRKTGTLRRVRAGSLIARNGMIAGSDSRKIREKYGASEIMRTARAVQAYWSRLDARKRKERMRNVFERYGEQYQT